MPLLAALEQPRPELRASLLLPQHQLDASTRGVGLALIGINLASELQLNMVVGVLGFRETGECDGLRLELQLEIRGGDVWRRDGQVDDVLGWLVG
jgi:hypothetical protein